MAYPFPGFSRFGFSHPEDTPTFPSCQSTTFGYNPALVTSTVAVAAGLAVQGGAVQQGVYAVANAATRLCLAHPGACARVGAALTLWDKIEDVGLQAKLAIQTAQGDRRAAETALELQLERSDNAPGW